jgi:hypothetical protein
MTGGGNQENRKNEGELFWRGKRFGEFIFDF